MKINNIILLLLTVMLSAVGCSSGSNSNSKDTGEIKNFNVPSVTLNSGYKMPVLGLGTWTQNNSTAENSVYVAIKEGYRLIDTARYYGNESGVGKGIKRAIDEGIIKRNEIFVTTKIMPGNYSNPDSAIDDSLNSLGLEYIDLMLIHQPGYNDENVYKALENGVKSGKLKSIGISNYYTPEDFERINKISEITPAVVQNENHIYYQNTDLQKYLERYGTVVESWYPFGGRGNTQEVFNNETITKIAKSHGKTSAQIILRWQIQAGYVVIPGSQNPSHIAENFDIFDFELTQNEMNEISNLNQNRRFENW
ncbi:MAG: aldo/keto reductase [Synergistaceae bacterium]|nr:aldo/keto reductase [Synergistaceae bacterium]